MYKSILVPTDGSKFADAAVEEAAKLAKELGSKLVLFSAVPDYYYQWPSFSVPIRPNEDEQARKAMETWAKEMLASAASNVNLAGVAVEQEFAVSNSPYEAIIAAARKFQCELIIMASHGRHGVSGVLLGSVTQKVLTHSTIPVLVVR